MFDDFNSIKVRLERFYCSLILLCRYFNSIKVRLELMNEYNINQQKLNFNSIKVRLELDSINGFKFTKEFQFHKGAIRTHFSSR